MKAKFEMMLRWVMLVICFLGLGSQCLADYVNMGTLTPGSLYYADGIRVVEGGGVIGFKLHSTEAVCCALNVV